MIVNRNRKMILLTFIHLKTIITIYLEKIFWGPVV